MSHSRGLLKPSSNPFFQTTASDIGIRPTETIVWTGNADPAMKCAAVSERKDMFGFLYSRESDRIGAMVPKPSNSTHKAPLTKTEFLKKRRELLRTIGPDEFDLELLSTTKKEELVKPDVEAVLKVFKQGTKVEDPRYTSTNNEYGKKAPTVATFVAERAARKQGFSKSFQGVKPQSTGLNTGLTKSNVHPKLDPQFA